MTVLFEYPEQALFDRVLPKSKIYKYANPSRSVRDLFVSQVDKIIWKYKLAPETINLPARQGAPEIQIFTILLKTKNLNEKVLQTIDKAIAFPIFYHLIHKDKIKTIAAYKRPSDADTSKWVVDSYFESEWLPAGTNRTSLPVVTDMAKLYEQMLHELMPLSPRKGETLKEKSERMALIRIKQREYQKLNTLLNKEKQFNRKVQFNSQLRNLKNELEHLTA
jgi:hypothetical protein